MANQGRIKYSSVAITKKSPQDKTGRKPVSQDKDTDKKDRSNNENLVKKPIKFGILKKLMAFSLIILSGSAFIGYAVYKSNQKVLDSDRWVQHTQQVMSKAENIASLDKDVEIAYRGFVIMNDSAFITSFDINEKNIFAEIRHLKQLTRDNPSQQHKIDSLIFYMHKRLDFSFQMAGLRGKQRPISSNSYISDKEARGYAGKIGNFIHSVGQEEALLLKQRKQTNRLSMEAFNRFSKAMFILMALIIILLLLVSGKYLHQSKEKLERAGELLLVNKVLISQNKEKEKRALELIGANREVRKAEDDTRLALKDLQKIMHSSLDVICTLDKEGRFVTVSSASERVWGYKPKELVGRKFIDFVFHEDVGKTIKADTKIMSGSPVTSFENRYVHKDGRIVTILWSSQWDESDGLSYCIAKDASEKKMLEKAFETERQQFYDLFLQAPFYIGLLKGPKYIFEMANPLYVNLIGKKNIIGKPLLEVLPELKGQGFIELLDGVYQTGEPFMGNEMPIKLGRGDSEKRADAYLNFVYHPYKNAGGNTEGIFFFGTDVTEQVLSRKKVQETENRFRTMIEKSIEMLTLTSIEGKILYGSPSVTKMLGYSLEEVASLSVLSFIHPEDIKSFAEKREQMLKAPGSSFYHQQRVRHKDGTWIWTEATVTNMLHEPGIHAMVANFRDISEKKMTEQQQEFDRNNLTALLNNTNDLMWSVDREFKLITSNQPFERIANLKSARPICKGTSVLLTEFQQGKNIHYKKLYERAFAGEAFTEIEYTHSPVELWSEISLYPIRKGNEVIGTACHWHDITERKRAEQKITESEIKYRALIEQASDTIIVVQTDGSIAEVNSSAEKLFGFTREELLKMTFKELLFDEKFSPRRAEVEKGKTLIYERKIKRKDKSPVNVEVSARMIHDGRIVGIFRDISERKKAQEEHDRLTTDIVQRNKDLEQFAYIVSHNLRAPVANILGASGRLNDPLLSKEKKDTLSAGLIESVKKLDSVIKDLNNILQVKRTINEIKEMVNFSQLVDDIKVSIKNSIETGGVKINCDFSEIEVFLTLKSYVYSIFYNLISNSIKYRKPGVPGIIDIKSRQSKHTIELFFKDNGRGIDLTKRGEQVFGLYKRFHADTEGKGMGLFMVKTQIETLGGKISINSKVNEGTEFKIEFLK